MKTINYGVTDNLRTKLKSLVSKLPGEQIVSSEKNKLDEEELNDIRLLMVLDLYLIKQKPENILIGYQMQNNEIILLLKSKKLHSDYIILASLKSSKDIDFQIISASDEYLNYDPTIQFTSADMRVYNSFMNKTGNKYLFSDKGLSLYKIDIIEKEYVFIDSPINTAFFKFTKDNVFNDEVVNTLMLTILKFAENHYKK